MDIVFCNNDPRSSISNLLSVDATLTAKEVQLASTRLALEFGIFFAAAAQLDSKMLQSSLDIQLGNHMGNDSLQTIYGPIYFYFPYLLCISFNQCQIVSCM